MTAFLLSLLLFVEFRALRAEEIAVFDNSTDSVHGEFELRSLLESWVRDIEVNGFDDVCYDVFESDGLDETAAIIQKDERECDEVAFDGGTNHGYPEGEGSLRFTGKIKDVKKGCLKRRKILNGAIQEISGTFSDGYPEGKVDVKLEGGLEMITFVRKGIPHGLFHAKTDERTIVGFHKNGQLHGFCWMIDKDKLLYESCTDAFDINGKSKTVLVYRKHLAYDETGYPNEAATAIIGFWKDEKFRHEAADVKIMKLHSVLQCGRSIQIKKNLPALFTYDLEKKKRVFEEGQPIKCEKGTTKGTEESSSALREYFRQISAASVHAMKPKSHAEANGEATSLLKNIEKIQDNLYEAKFTLYTSTKVRFRHVGDRDASGRFQGYTKLQMINDCVERNETCPYPTFEALTGYFVNGILEGPVNITTIKEQRQQFSGVASGGVLEGIVVAFGTRMIFTTEEFRRAMPPIKRAFYPTPIGLVARFSRGVPVGKTFLGLIGNNETTSPFLYGHHSINSDSDLVIGGDDAAFLYPFYEMALKGRFEDNIMVKARQAVPVKTTCRDDFIDVEFDVVEEDDFEYFFDPATPHTPSSHPTVRDPYEVPTLEVRSSNIDGAGDGAFAIRDIRNTELVALYGGLRSGPHDNHSIIANICREAEGTGNPCDKYSIGGNDMGGLTVLPTPWDDWRGRHNSTSAWKLNNAFEPDANCELHKIDHPRFGTIPAASAIRDIKAGEELLIDYGYHDSGDGHSKNHQWYYDQKRQHFAKLEELRSQKNDGKSVEKGTNEEERSSSFEREKTEL